MPIEKNLHLRINKSLVPETTMTKYENTTFSAKIRFFLLAFCKGSVTNNR